MQWGRWGREAQEAGVGKTLKAIQAHLANAQKHGQAQVERGGESTGAGGETISDDAPLRDPVRAKIVRTESVVRQVLALVGVDYDALLAPGGAYARAVQAKPGLSAEVLAAEEPVLAAVQVALAAKAAAEPAKQEEAPKGPEVGVDEASGDVGGPDRTGGRLPGLVFSQQYGRVARPTSPRKEKQGLNDVFMK
jgi:hypothetical protein